MSKGNKQTSKQARLTAALRDNLRRRKAVSAKTVAAQRGDDSSQKAQKAVPAKPIAAQLGDDNSQMGSTECGNSKQAEWHRDSSASSQEK